MSTAQTLLPLPVVCPIVGAILAPLLSKLHRRLPLVIGIGALVASVALLCVVAAEVYSGSGSVVAHYFSNEKPVHGAALGIAFAADPFGLTFALLSAAVGLLLLAWLLSELGDIGPRELGFLACLSQLLLAALIGAALTADTINMFVWFEVAALASYGLTGFFLERPSALEAAFKVMVLTSTAGFLVFVGSAMLYTTDGALNLGQLTRALPPHLGRAEVVALALLIAGYGTKAGLVPFHGWLPDAHAQGPSAVSAMFSALMVDVGIIAIVRLSLQVYAARASHVLGLLTTIGIVSALLGALMALVQDDLKRLLAWDTGSQAGIMLVGFATDSTKGVAGAVYHLVNHGLFKALLFLTGGAIVHATGLTKLSQLGGLARKRPLTTAGFTIGTLAIAGVPPLNGYVSLGLIHESLHHEPLVYALAIAAQIITVAALGRACYLAFYRRREEPYEHLEPSRWGMRISMVVLGAGCIGFGVLAEPFVHRVAGPAAAIVLDPVRYATGVLAGSGPVGRVDLSFHYADPIGLLATAGEVLGGLLLAAWTVRGGRLPGLAWLRRVHTGSVNDYAAYAVTGLLVCGVVLLV